MSVRLKRRYIAFQVSGGRIDKERATKVLRSLLQQIFLSQNAHEVEPKLISFDEVSQRGLLRCGHKLVAEFKDKMKEAKGIDGKEARLVILGVSGTIKAAKRKFLSAGEKYSMH
ncbi:MAG: hypothetical protein NZ934_00235 [Hadesarchaea archaeon]|nr:hypothetical protein [Hadesarchaea archaeon]